MKKSLLTVLAILVLVMLSSSVVTAEPTHPNEVGLYLTDDGLGATGTFVVEAPVTVYLVLTKPTDVYNNDAPYTSISAFNCALHFNPPPPWGDLVLFNQGYPAPAVDLGIKDLNNGVWEFRVGYGTPIPVTDESVNLVSMDFYNFAVAPIMVSLSAPDRLETPEMDFEAEGGDLRVMHPISGSHDAPVFIFGGDGVVAVEKESFGSVKALYR